MKKKIAPIVVVIVMAIFIALWMSVGFWGSILEGMGPIGIFFLVMGIGALGVLIAVLISRMKEIDNEDEDDLKKY